MKRFFPYLIFVLLAFFGVTSLYMVFMVVPNERVMGAVQRIFYFHVGSAIASYVTIFALFVSSILYLLLKDRKVDAVLQACGEVGFLLCSQVMVTGMIWANSAWNTPFRLEPRLVSFLFLWLIFLAFVVLRAFGDTERIASHTAILGVIATISLPIVIFSIKLLPQFAQLHPQVIERRGLRDPSFKEALFLATLTMIFLQGVLIWIRTKMIFLDRRI